jgi:hypothetical protein
MAKPTKFLVATDSRFPLTIALDQAFATGKISPEVLAARKKELVELVSEAAKTFGFQSKTTLTNAFDMSVGLLSLALVSATKGDSLPDRWANHAVAQNWKSLVKESISMVRAIKEKDEAYDYLFDGDQDPRILRDLLRDFVRARDTHQQWVGYAAFVRYRNERHRLQSVDTLIRWLIKSRVRRPLYWMKDPIEGPTCADEALNTLLFRICTGLGFGQKDIILTEKEFRHVRAQYEDSSAQWLKDGQTHYEALLHSIPETLQSVMDEKWFPKRLGKGPPKVKKWESDDLRGITGFYYYQMHL